MIAVVNQQTETALLVVKSDALGGGKRTTDWKQLLGQYFFTAFKLVGNHDRLLVEVMYLDGRHSRHGVEHSCLNSATSGNAISGIHSS